MADVRFEGRARGYCAAAQKVFVLAGFALEGTTVEAAFPLANHTYHLVDVATHQMLAIAHVSRNEDKSYSAWISYDSHDQLERSANAPELPEILPEPVYYAETEGAKSAAIMALRDAGYDMGEHRVTPGTAGTWDCATRDSDKRVATAVVRRDWDAPGLAFHVHVVRFDEPAPVMTIDINACRAAQDTLKTALSNAYSDAFHADIAGAVKRALAETDSDALGIALAAETDHYSYDGRLSQKNRTWACDRMKSYSMPEKELHRALCARYVSQLHHMTILDAAVSEYRRQTV